MDYQGHLAAAEKAFAAARALRETNPEWSMVPLHYTAMHLLHASFDFDELPPERRHPSQHKSRWKRGGGDQHREVWGTTDVIRAVYPAAVSVAYTSLFAASHAARYTALGFSVTDRFWGDYDLIQDFVVDKFGSPQPGSD